MIVNKTNALKKYLYSRRIFLFFIFLLLYSCSSIQVNKTYKNNDLYELLQLHSGYEEFNDLLFVDIKSQNMFYLKKGTVFKEYNISSSYYGTGSIKNSLQTPLGKHTIYKKIGEDVPENAILKGRQWTGAVANIISEKIDTDYDHVTSRILWLDGLEEGINKGGDVDSRERYIYIHGTAEEGLIGVPASDGCIRMYNKEVVELFDLVDIGTQVWIY